MPMADIDRDTEGFTEIEQGFLEQSNSTSLTEMTSLIVPCVTLRPTKK